MVYTCQGREDSVEAPELRTTKKQYQIGGYSLTYLNGLRWPPGVGIRVGRSEAVLVEDGRRCGDMIEPEGGRGMLEKVVLRGSPLLKPYDDLRASGKKGRRR